MIESFMVRFDHLRFDVAETAGVPLPITIRKEKSPGKPPSIPPQSPNLNNAPAPDHYPSV